MISHGSPWLNPHVLLHLLHSIDVSFIIDALLEQQWGMCLQKPVDVGYRYMGILVYYLISYCIDIDITRWWNIIFTFDQCKNHFDQQYWNGRLLVFPTSAGHAGGRISRQNAKALRYRFPTAPQNLLQKSSMSKGSKSRCTSNWGRKASMLDSLINDCTSVCKPM